MAQGLIHPTKLSFAALGSRAARQAFAVWPSIAMTKRPRNNGIPRSTLYLYYPIATLLNSRVHMRKSFLLLFFKKEALALP
jgi:hypothetical protein